VKIQSISAIGQLRQTVCETPSQPIENLGMVVHTCHPSYKSSINKRIKIQATWGKKQAPISKISKAKRAGTVDQLAEHLPRKHEALSNSYIFKNKQKCCFFITVPFTYALHFCVYLVAQNFFSISFSPIMKVTNTMKT
jgi:hypothetical protein